MKGWGDAIACWLTALFLMLGVPAILATAFWAGLVPVDWHPVAYGVAIFAFAWALVLAFRLGARAARARRDVARR